METTEPDQQFILVTRTSGVECVQRGLQEIEPWTNVLSADILRTLDGALKSSAAVFHGREQK